jgi:hypothetical protein
MLDIIRRGNSGDLLFTPRRELLQAKTNKEQPALVRAPGISTNKPESILKPIARAATMPAEFKQRKSVDFEPFEGPSLFSNFKRSQTTDERIQQWQQDRDLATTSRKQSHTRSQCASVCGDISKGFKHVYLTSEFYRPAMPYGGSHAHHLPPCKKCTILCETLDRLRQNLSLSEQSSPKPEAQPQFVAERQKHYMENVRGSSAPSKPCTQQLSPDLITTAQQKELVTKADAVRTLEHSPEPRSRQDEIVLMQRLALDSRRASLRKHRSVPGLGLQKSEGDTPHNVSGQTRQSGRAVIDSASRRPAPISATDEPNLEDELCVAELAAVQERVTEYDRCQLRRQADKIHHRARQVFESESRSYPPPDQAVRGSQTLYSRMVQAEKNPLLQGERCYPGTEQRGQSLISAGIKRVQAENSKPVPERLDQTQGPIQDLDAQLSSYMRSFRVTESPSQLETVRRAEK